MPLPVLERTSDVSMCIQGVPDSAGSWSNRRVENVPVPQNQTRKRAEPRPENRRRLRRRVNVALAVRMSMSIPVFFEPVKFANPQMAREHLIVDGGMLSNFPVWLFDAEEPLWPTFGLKLVEKNPRVPLDGGSPRQEGPSRSGVLSVVDYLRSLVDTMMAAHDRLYIEQSDFDRTIAIDTLGVRTTEFDLPKERAMELFDSGRTAAEKFLDEYQRQAPAAMSTGARRIP